MELAAQKIFFGEWFFRMGEKSKILQALIAITSAGLIVYLFLFMPLRSTAPLNISCTGTTNDPATGPLSILTVSNTSSFELRLWPFPPETNSTGVWVRTSRGTAIYMTMLPAHSVYTFTVATVTGHETWRVPVGWDYDRLYAVEFARRYLMDNIKMNISRLSQGQYPDLSGGNHSHVHPAYSPEFKN